MLRRTLASALRSRFAATQSDKIASRRRLIDRAIRPVLESLEDRRLLSGVAGAASVAAGSTYTLHLDSTGLPATTQWAVDWNDGATATSTAGATSLTHTYASPGVYRATATVVGSAAAVPLGLDPSFGTAGKVVDPFGETSDRASAVLVQPDGKVLVGGSTHGTTDRQALARYNADGSLDATFGTAGHVVAAYSADNADQVYAVALQSDGKILAAGTSFGGGQLALFRYTAAGVLDATFGSGGKVLTNLGDIGAGANAVVVQLDGKVVVAGGVASAASGSQVGLVRYTSAGALDTTFASSSATPGVLLTGFQGSYDFATSLALQPDGKLVAGGWQLGTGGWNFGIARFTTAGAPDTTFGTPATGTARSGSLWTELAYATGGYNNDFSNALVIQPDGSIVAAGSTYQWTGSANRDRFALVKYTSAGDLDTTFGGGGIVTTALGDGDARASGLVRTASGRLVAGGYAMAGGHAHFALSAYHADGSTDPTFGVSGVLLTSFGDGTSATDAGALGLAQGSDGRLFAAGWATDASGHEQFATAAFLPGPALTVTGTLAAPTGLAATAHTGGGVDLAWTAVTGVTGYTVSRSTTPDFSAGVTTLATGVTTAAYTDPTADTGTTYYYWVSAESDAGDSAPSAPASIATLGTPHDAIQDGSFEEPYLVDNSGTGDLSATAWTAAGWAGVKALTHDADHAPVGRQFGFVSYAGTLSQTLTLTGGQYTISYLAETSPYATAANSETVDVLIDGTVVDSFTPTGTGYQFHETPTLSLSAGTHTLTLQDPHYNLYSEAWVDDVRLSLLAPAGIPLAPTRLIATPTSATTVGLSWTNSATDQTGFAVDRATDSGFTQNLLTRTTTSAAFSDSGLTTGTTYYYRVRATNATGASANSAAAGVVPRQVLSSIAVTPGSSTVAGGGTQALSAVAKDQVGNALAIQPPITWSVGSGGAGAINPANGLYTAPATGSGSVTVRAVAGGVVGTATIAYAAAPTGIDGTPPTAPTDLATSGSNPARVDLGWSASTDAVGVTGYEVERDGVSLGQTANRFYRDGGLAASTTHTYTVRAFDAAGNYSPWATVTATTAALPGVPAIPTGFSATTLSASTSLTWSAPGIGTPTGYELSRDGVVLARLGGTQFSFEDGGMGDGPHTYSLRAIAEAGGQVVYGPAAAAQATWDSGHSPAPESAPDQFVPQADMDFLYNELVKAVRDRFVMIPNSPADPSPLGRWLDAAPPKPSTTGETLGSTNALPNPDGSNIAFAPNLYFLDRNGTGLYDPGEEVWANQQTTPTQNTFYTPNPVDDGSGFVPPPDVQAPGTFPNGWHVPDGAVGIPGVLFSDANGDGRWESGETIVSANPLQIHGAQNQLAYYDVAGDGHWEEGDPIWVSGGPGDNEYAAGDQVLYNPNAMTLTPGAWGKKQGLNWYHNGGGNTWADGDIIWSDGSGDPAADFKRDLLNLYTDVETLLPYFRDPNGPYASSSLTLGAALDAVSGSLSIPEGTGSIDYIDDGAVELGPTTVGGVDVKSGDWVEVGGQWYTADVISSSSMFLQDDNADNPPVDPGVTSFTIVNWTEIPDDPANGLSYVRGKPGADFGYGALTDAATLPVFRQQLVELRGVVNQLNTLPDAYDASRYDATSSDEALTIATREVDLLNAVGSPNDAAALKLKIESGLFDPGAVRSSSNLENLRDAAQTIAGSIYGSPGSPPPIPRPVPQTYWAANVDSILSENVVDGRYLRVLDHWTTYSRVDDPTGYYTTDAAVLYPRAVSPEHLPEIAAFLDAIDTSQMWMDGAGPAVSGGPRVAEWWVLTRIPDDPENPSGSFHEEWIHDGTPGETTGDQLMRVQIESGYSYGSMPGPAPSIGEVPDVPADVIPLTSEMGYRNVVPDSEWDGIVQVPTDLAAFGNDTGVIDFDPTRPGAQVYVPLATDRLTPLPIHVYLSEGGFASGDGQPLLAAPWDVPGADEHGQPYAYNLNETLRTNLLLNAGENHVKRLEVIRPQGNAVVFNFAWDAQTRQFSNVGYPIGIDQARQYVLRAGGDGETYDLQFASGIVHTFVNGGPVSAVRDAAGNAVDLWQLDQDLSIEGYSPISGGAKQVWGQVHGLNYNVDLQWQHGLIDKALYHSRDGSQTVTTQLSYSGTPGTAGAGNLKLTGLQKTDAAAIEEFSYAYDPAAGTITHNGSVTSRTGLATDTGGVTITATMADGVYSRSVNAKFNALGLVTSTSVTLSDGTTTSAPAVTAYQYLTDTQARYAANQSAKWAKIAEIDYADGSWEKFQYDPTSGWLTKDITPFKTGSGSDGNQRVSTYGYDSTLSGNGLPAVSQTWSERPRTVTTTVGGTATGTAFYRYNAPVVSDGESVAGAVETRVAETPGATWENSAKWDTLVTPEFNGLGQTVVSSLGMSSTVGTRVGTSGQPPQGISFAGSTNGAAGAGVSITASTLNMRGNALQVTSSRVLSGSSPNVQTSNLTATQDAFGRITHTSDSISGLTEDYSNWGWFGPGQIVNADKSVTTLTYDAAGMVETSSTYGVKTTYMYDADGNVVATDTEGGYSSPTGTPPHVTTSATYDALDRLTSSIDAVGKTTGYSYSTSGGMRVTTTTLPDFTTLVDSAYLDGTAASSAGTAAYPTAYDSGIDAPYNPNTDPSSLGYVGGGEPTGGYWTQTSTNGGANVSRTYFNFLGQPYKTSQTGPNGNTVWATTTYDDKGRAHVQTAFDGTQTVTDYNNDDGGVADVFVDMDKSGDFTPGDRKTTFTRSYTTDHGKPVFRTVTSQLGDASTPATTDVTEQSIDGQDIWETIYGVTTHTHTSLPTSPGVFSVTTDNPTGSVVDDYADGLLQSETTYGPSGTQITKQTFAYDSLMRNNSVTDVRDGVDSQTTSYTFLADGSVDTVTGPDSRVQSVSGRDPKFNDPSAVTRPDGGSDSTPLDGKGNVTSRSGAGVTPETFTYDPNTGQLTGFTTYRSGTLNGSGAATTSFGYDPATGLLTSKTYAGGGGDTFTYSPDLHLHQVDHGGVIATYAQVDGAGGSNSVTYQGQHELTIETGPRDVKGRATQVSESESWLDSLGDPHGTSYVTHYQYTAADQLQQESTDSVSGGAAVTYGYYAPADTSSTASPNALQSVTLSQGGTPLTQTAYAYDPATQRLQTITAGSQGFTYAYKPGTNLLQSVTAANGQTTTYTYEDLTDRLHSIVTTDANGSVLYSATYAYNANDQRTTAALAGANADGGVYSQNWGYTYDGYDQLHTATRNGSTQTYSFDALGNRTDVGSANDLNQYDEFFYDARGNLTGDGTFTYGYDDLDRLTSATPDAPATGSLKVTMGYGAQGRRIWKKTFAWDGSAWSSTAASYTKFAYEGWNLIAEFDAGGSSDVMSRSYAWGQNLGGGIGGLLSVTTYGLNGRAEKTYLPVYEGSGNVVALTDASTGAVAATFEYDAFGNTLATTGSAEAIAADPLRFSTKYFDSETGLYYYGYRYYSPGQRRFITRDPSGEANGGVNLYAFVGNDPVNNVDPFGESAWEAVKGFGAVVWGIEVYSLKSMVAPVWKLYDDIQAVKAIGADYHGLKANGYSQSSAALVATAHVLPVAQSAARINDWMVGRSGNGIDYGRLLTDQDYGAATAMITIDLGLSASGGASLLNALRGWGGKLFGVKSMLPEMSIRPAPAASINTIPQLEVASSFSEPLSQLRPPGPTVTLAELESLVSEIRYASGRPVSVPRTFQLPTSLAAEAEGSAASSVNAGAALRSKLSALEDAQSAAVRTRTLPDGRIRYYGPEKAARTPGPTRGAASALEWDPATGRVRMWWESYDQAGNVSRVHPKMFNGQQVNAPHYPPTGKELGQ